MACDLTDLNAGKLRLPQLNLPSITRPDLSGSQPPEKNDLSEIQECLAIPLPFGGDLKLPKDVTGFQGADYKIIQDGLKLIELVSSFMIPMEAITKILEPISTVLEGLSSDPIEAVTDLISLGEDLANILTTLTSTYPILLLAQLTVIIEKICEALSLFKNFIIESVKFMESLVTGLGDIVADVTSKITESVTKKTASAIKAATDIDQKQEKFDDKINFLLDKNNLSSKNTAAYLGNIVGGAPTLAAEGLQAFSEQVVSPVIDSSGKKVRNFLVAPPNLDEKNKKKQSKGNRGTTSKIFNEQKARFLQYHDRLEQRRNKEALKLGLKFQADKDIIDLQLPQLEGCFEDLLKDLSDQSTQYLQGAQKLVDNILQSTIDNMGAVFSDLAIPLLESIPVCP